MSGLRLVVTYVLWKKSFLLAFSIPPKDISLGTETYNIIVNYLNAYQSVCNLASLAPDAFKIVGLYGRSLPDSPQP